MAGIELRVSVEEWPFSEPFQITGYRFDEAKVIFVEAEQDGFIGRGEASGVYYRGETTASMSAQLGSVRAAVEQGADRSEIQRLLAPGGARNALDCAMWDLEAKRAGKPVWELAGLSKPKAITTSFTCAADTPERMAAKAKSYKDSRALKLKLTGSDDDGDRVRAVREACPQEWIGIDANQGFDRAGLESLLPALVDCRVSLIEQPFPIGDEADLDGLQSPIPIAADESAQSLSDILGLVGRFNIINIKLDKCGGLTEALAMVNVARNAGLGVMVGCMTSTSLSMAPAYLVGQLCEVVDLDGPIYLAQDREPPANYESGLVTMPPALWGYPT